MQTGGGEVGIMIPISESRHCNGMCPSDAWSHVPCSIQEEGLYDHVIYNDNLEEASQQLAEIAERALNGETGATAPSSEAQVALLPPPPLSCSSLLSGRRPLGEYISNSLDFVTESMVKLTPCHRKLERHCPKL